MADADPRVDGCTATSGAQCTNPVDPTDPSSKIVHTDNTAVYVQPADPDHGVQSTSQQMTGVTAFPPPANTPVKMDGFVANCELRLLQVQREWCVPMRRVLLRLQMRSSIQRRAVVASSS
jgi:hypothetical protein